VDEQNLETKNTNIGIPQANNTPRDNAPLVTPRPPIKKVRRVFFVIAVLALIILAVLALGLFVLGGKKTNNKAQTISPVGQASRNTSNTKTVLGQSKITFPKITGLTPLPLQNVPADIQLFSMPGATEQVYNTIQYENNETGIQFSFIMPDSTVNPLIMELYKQLQPSGTNKSTWLMQGGSSIDTVGYLDFLHDASTDQAHLTFLQKDKNVNVIIQTLLNHN
jgi:hypothetical protein